MTELLTDRLTTGYGSSKWYKALDEVRALEQRNAELEGKLQDYCDISNIAHECVQAIKKERDEFKAKLLKTEQLLEPYQIANELQKKGLDLLEGNLNALRSTCGNK